MERKPYANRIINEILSNPSPAAVLLMKSDGASIGFLTELANYRKHTYWLNTEFDNLHSFIMEIAKKVFAEDEDEFRKILQFKHCEYDFNKDAIIINKIHEKIASLEGDCLLIIDNIEVNEPLNNKEMIELFLKNSPRNLKTVLVSEKFIDINYNIFKDGCPILIDVPPEDENSLSCEELLKEKLSYDDKAFLCYVSQKKHLSKKFLCSLYDGAEKLLEYMNRRYRNLVFCKGGELFFFDVRMHERLAEKEPELLQSELFQKDLNKLLCEYYIAEGKAVKALENAVREKDMGYAEKAAEALIKDREKTFILEEYVNDIRDKIIFPDIPPQYRCLKLIRGFTSLCLGKYAEVREILNNEITAFEENSDEEIFARTLYFLSLTGDKKYEQAVLYARGLYENRSQADFNKRILALHHIVARLPLAIKNSGLGFNMADFRSIEYILSHKNNCKEIWFAEALQAMAEAYFDFGHYGKAMDYIKQIKAMLPFYVIPYKLMGFYYYAGEMKEAETIAKQAIQDAMNYSIDTDFADIYTLLAKVSMYYNKREESLNYIDKAVTCKGTAEAGKIYAIAVRSILLARTGKAEYGRDVAKIYAKYCELKSLKNVFYLYGAISYCEWVEGNNDEALYYARKCVAKASVRSGIWLLASAISINVLMEKDELRDAKSIVEKILFSIVNYGMLSVAADYYECFEKLVSFASEKGIAPEYVKILEDKLSEKLLSYSYDDGVYVKFMGDSCVTVAGEEIKWKTKKEKELFLLYVWQGEQGLDRNFILSVLWPDYVYTSAINNLKTTNNNMRKTLAAAGVEFEMSYGNGKYYLKIEKLHSDYNFFLSKIDAYKANSALSVKLNAAREILTLYNGGFAKEITQSYFRKYGDNLRDKVRLITFTLINELTEAGEYIEAKRLINLAESVDDTGEYGLLARSVEVKFKDYYERA